MGRVDEVLAVGREKPEIEPYCGPSGRGLGSWQREARDRAILLAEWTRSWHLAERSQRYSHTVGRVDEVLAVGREKPEIEPYCGPSGRGPGTWQREARYRAKYEPRGEFDKSGVSNPKPQRINDLFCSRIP